MANKNAVGLNPKEPAWIIWHKAGDRCYSQVFQGEDAQAEAKAEASLIAGRTGHEVFVFGPQTNVFKRPPKVEAIEEQLDFLKDR